MIWRVVYTRHAQKDAKKIAKSNLKKTTKELISLLEQDPFQNPPQFEKPIGDLGGAYSRRINIQHRLIYQVLTEERVVKILRMWTHYE
ncbi:MAG: Txe/YoeB family addiction module toxin [Lysobacterales bacterium]